MLVKYVVVLKELIFDRLQKHILVVGKIWILFVE